MRISGISMPLSCVFERQIMKQEFKIGEKTVGQGHPCYCVAELSGNHNGSFERAKEIIYAAHEAGADAVKLQTYTADSLALNCNNEYFRLKNGGLWDGRNLYDLYTEAATPYEWQPKLMELANSLGMECFSSPFDIDAVERMHEWNMPAYKIASYEINEVNLIRKAASMHKPIIFATGIALKEDLDLAMQICREEGNEEVFLLKCVSAYPTPYEDVNLNMIPTLKEMYGCLVGLSDHTMGSTVPVGAAALGIKMVEKHLTLKRADGGVDSGFSMEPDEFRKMVTDIRIMEKALGKSEYGLTPKQIGERDLSRSLFVAADVKAGDKITPENIRSVRPHAGLETKYYEEILGKTFAKDIKMGEPLRPDDIGRKE